MKYDYKPEKPGYYQFRNSLGASTYKRKWDGCFWYSGDGEKLLTESHPLSFRDIDRLQKNGDTYELIADLNRNPISSRSERTSVQFELFDYPE